WSSDRDKIAARDFYRDATQGMHASLSQKVRLMQLMYDNEWALLVVRVHHVRSSLMRTWCCSVWFSRGKRCCIFSHIFIYIHLLSYFACEGMAFRAIPL